MGSHRMAVASFLILTLFCSIVNQASGKTRQIVKNKHKLDILFIYDESEYLKRGGIDSYQFYTTMNTVRRFFDEHYSMTGNEDTRYAVIGSHSNSLREGQIYLFFDGSGKAGDQHKEWPMKFQKAEQLVNQTRENSSDGKNIEMTFRTVLEKIFQSSKGDRPDAPNIVYYVSDCLFCTDCTTAVNLAKRITTETDKAEARKLFNASSEYLIVCIKSYLSLGSMTQWATDLANNDRTKVVFDKEQILTVEQMREILPQPTIETVTDCEYDEFTITPDCRIIPQHGCVKVKYPNIIQPSDSSEDSNKCPENKTIKCDNFEDCCNKWKQVRCCDREKYFERDVSNTPGCTPAKIEKDPACKAPCSGAPSVVRTTTKKPTTHRPPIVPPKPHSPIRPPTTPPPGPKPAEVVTTEWSITDENDEVPNRPQKTTGRHDKPGKKSESQTTVLVVIGIVGGIVFLLVLFLAAFLCTRRRRSKNKLKLEVINNKRHFKFRTEFFKLDHKQHGRKGHQSGSTVTDNKARLREPKRGRGLENKSRTGEKGIKANVLDEKDRKGKKHHHDSKDFDRKPREATRGANVTGYHQRKKQKTTHK